MSSATPIRPGSSDRNLMIIVSVATIAVLVFVIAIIWAFFAGGYAHAFVNWMYETSIGAFVRYVLESLLLLVVVLVFLRC